MKKILTLILFLLTTLGYGQSFYDFCQVHGRTIAPSYEKVNCVQFMDLALRQYLRIQDPILSKYIYINYSKEVIEKAIIDKNTSILGGVSYGLVKGGYAEWVELKDIKQGDIVQYWSTDGFINGHCGIFEGYDKFGNFILVGSHGDSQGYGLMNCYNTSIKCQFYICRLK